MNWKKITLVLLAVAVGLIFSLENIIPYQQTKNNPDLVYTVFNGGDENLYAAQVREVYEGKLFSGDAYIYETKSRPTFLQWSGPLAFGLIAKAINSLDAVFILGDFFFPAVMFLLLYYLVNLFTKNYWGAIVISLSVLFLSQLTTKIPPISLTMGQNLINILTLKEPLLLNFSTLITRQFSFTIFLLFILSLYFTLTKPGKLWAITSGIISGLLAYIYVFYWTTSLVVIAIAFALALLNRDFKLSRKLLLTLFIAVMISGYYLLSYFGNQLLDKQIVSGRIEGRYLEPLTSLRYGLFSLVVWLILPRGPFKFLTLSFYLAAVVLMNLQLVLGYSMDPGHWPSSTFEPLLPVFAGSAVLILKKNWRYLWLLIFPILIFSVFNQFASAKEYLPYHQLSRQEQSLFDWINQNAEAEAVILTLDKRLNRYLPVETAANLYLPYGPFTQLSIEQTWERADLAFSLLDMSEAAMRAKLLDTQFVGQLFEQAYNYDKTNRLNGLEFPDKVREKIMSMVPIYTLGLRYIPDNIKREQVQNSQRLAQTPFSDRLCLYRLDYVLISPQDKPLVGDISSKYFLPVFAADGLELYRVNSQVCQ